MKPCYFTGVEYIFHRYLLIRDFHPREEVLQARLSVLKVIKNLGLHKLDGSFPWQQGVLDKRCGHECIPQFQVCPTLFLHIFCKLSLLKNLVSCHFWIQLRSPKYTVPLFYPLVYNKIFDLSKLKIMYDSYEGISRLEDRKCSVKKEKMLVTKISSC